MATAPQLSDEIDTNTNGTHLEMFCIIWLDANPHESRDTEQKLRSIINYFKKFQDIPQCQKYIEQTTQNDRLILIVNGQMGQEIVPLVDHFRQVISIYVYCMDKEKHEEWALRYSKIKAIVINLDEMISKIYTDHKIQKKVEEPLAINIYTAGQSTSGINGQFVFSQVLIDCLLRLKSTQADFNELIDYCKTQYAGNCMELSLIQEFEQKYSSQEALWWYTRESFFYKTLNAALRTQNIHLLFLFREFIRDIHRQLQKEQSKSRIRVYRGQVISSDELDTLKASLDQFISVNSFFSTSTDYKTALRFLKMSTASNDLEKIIFQIDAHPKMVTTKPFADITEHSYFTKEAEILFMIGSIFRLQSVSRNDDDVWIIRMILYSDNEHDLKQVLMYMKQQTGSGETNLQTLGKVLWEMGKVDLAAKYFTRFVEQLPSSDPLLTDLFEDLGKLASLREDYDISMRWHQKALILKEQLRNQNQSTINRFTKKFMQRFTEEKSEQSVSPNNIYTQWKPHGITLAGKNAYGDELNQLNYPSGICIDNDQKSIYIADTYHHRIVEWNLNTKRGRVIAGGNDQGNQINQLYFPTDVTVDTKNNSLIICDKGNSRVVEWSRQNGTEDGQILISDIECWGVTIDKNGYIYVSDTEMNEVRRWKRGQPNGIIVAGGNGKGNHLNQLNEPSYLFIDQDDSLYVSDSYNDRVIKWMKNSKEGIIVAGGQGHGNRLTQLSGPNGMIVDHLGNVYIADYYNDRVMCWLKDAKQGRIIVGGNGKGEKSNQLKGPKGISFDREDNLYVVDYGNNRVQKFEIN